MTQRDFKRLSIAISANFVAEMATLPITVTRVIYQTNTITIQETLAQIKSRKAHFSGLLPSLSSKALSIGLKYALYQKLKDYRQTPKEDLLNNALNGFGCGIIGTVITNPLLVWRTQLQRGEDMKLSYSYRGLGYSILRSIPLYTLLFPVHDYYKHQLSLKGYDGIKQSIIASIATSLTNYPLIQPFDYIRTRKAAGLNIEWTWKLNRYYRGGLLALSRNIPHLVIAMSLIDTFNRYFKI